MDLELHGKRVLVTGGSRGIGRACALSFAREGCRLVLVARGEEDLVEAAEEARRAGAPEAHVGRHDLSTEAGCAAAAAEAEAAVGGIDVLVNNVGGRSAARLFGDPALTATELTASFELSVQAGLRLTLALLPGMCQRGEGAVLFVASIWGREAGGAPAYNVAKAAEIALARALAAEALPRGVRINAVAPGSILFPGGSWDRRLRERRAETEDFVRREIPGGRFGRPEEVADVVVFLASPRARWVAGACMVVDGGQSRSF